MRRTGDQSGTEDNQSVSMASAVLFVRYREEGSAREGSVNETI